MPSTSISTPRKNRERIKEFESKPIMAEKKVSQHTLGLHNAFDLLSELGCLELAVFPDKYNESLVTKFYANLIADIDDPNSPVVGQVYVRGQVTIISPANIADFLSCPHYASLEGSRLERDFELSAVAKILLWELDQKKNRQVTLPSLCLISDFILGYKDLSLPSDSLVRELDVMVMPKLIGLGIAPPSSTHLVPRATRPTRNKIGKKK
ncbi:hypothetical protein M9H77_07346 [Catharanthus roseus]|uniref:Uncharacterized protein n=1 Tax=Catharanthus roseus TaxID=4058 RepID=A0ACC0BUQ4_CATRO|nr:hypothetical protein M9H77_07346 [Catharanthus roseus]